MEDLKQEEEPLDEERREIHSARGQYVQRPHDKQELKLIRAWKRWEHRNRESLEECVTCYGRFTKTYEKFFYFFHEKWDVTAAF